ncbi:hypothetical protein [Streptomyces sp. NPDC059597]|uniref:hypothetical protein n=1 Tax=Streptomyces sp. NPDC059597 TaxID=3346879 RepID=UPI00369404A8
MNTAADRARSLRPLSRVLLLLLVLLVPHVQAPQAAPAPGATTVAECEHEVPLTPSRSIGRTVGRPDAPALTPAPEDAAPSAPRARPTPATPSPAPRPRTVVLRC